MASLWMRTNAGERVETTLGDRPFVLAAAADADADGRARAADATPAERPGASVTLVQTGDVPTARWVLVTVHGAHVTVNGEPVLTGLRVLDSRDEIRRGPTVAVFTDEHPARVEPFPGAAHAVRCARCTCDIAAETQAVRCPGCGSWYHQQVDGDFPCWTAVPFCQACGCATTTAADGWEPEEF
jgi:hypothetical protein